MVTRHTLAVTRHTLVVLAKGAGKVSRCRQKGLCVAAGNRDNAGGRQQELCSTVDSMGIALQLATGTMNEQIIYKGEIYNE